MKKTAFWEADWVLGLIVALVLFCASGSDLVQSLERLAYDWGVRASSHAPSMCVAVIAIDDQSIASIGRWPWSREVHAQMIVKLKQAGAKVVGYASFFFEPQIDPGLAYVAKLTELYQALPPPQQQNLAQFASVLGEAEDALNTDRKLAAAITEAGNVALPMLFILGEPRGNPDKPLPDYVLKNQITKVVDRIGAQDNNRFPVPMLQAAAPMQEIAAGAATIGHYSLADAPT
jgi:serine/threonine-protein kinase